MNYIQSEMCVIMCVTLVVQLIVTYYTTIQQNIFPNKELNSNIAFAKLTKGDKNGRSFQSINMS